jgi:protease II
MTARLQAANAGGGPILLRTSYDTGHGGSTPLDARINEVVDEFAFYFYYLGVNVTAATTVSAR